MVCRPARRHPRRARLVRRAPGSARTCATASTATSGRRPSAAGYAADGPRELVEIARTAPPPNGSAVQVLDRSGRVLVAFGAADADAPLVPADVRFDALLGDSEAVRIDTGHPPRHYRAYVLPVRRLGRRHVLVVAESMQDAEAPTRRVLALLLLAGPAALAATALVGWWLARILVKKPLLLAISAPGRSA